MIYLASPYSHSDPAVKEQRFKSVCRAAAKIMKEGRYVFSPIAHTHPISMEGDIPGVWEYWEGYDRFMLSKCDELMVLKLEGWETSIGVQSEIKIATELGLKISYLEPV